jgi:hypothetical protein
VDPQVPSEDAQGAGREPYGAVGVTAGAATRDDRQPTVEPAVQLRVDPARREVGEVRGDRGQPVDAGAAPPSRLYGRPGTVARPLPIPDEPWIIDSRVLRPPGALLREPLSVSDGIAMISVRGDTESDVIDRLAQVTETALRASASADS